jgi:putative tryptophan/tyrosine transport system substrate-binding protein
MTHSGGQPGRNLALLRGPDVTLINAICCPRSWLGQQMQIDRLKRRDFITLIGAAAAWPLAARAQQRGKVARIGYLGFTSASASQPGLDALRAGLRNLGYVEGENLQIEFRYAADDIDLLPGLAAELVRLNVDVIVTYATGVAAAQRATSTIPIVMATYSDAVAMGVATSLANPGGNITGSTYFYPELMAKRLELLREVAPSITRAGVLLLRGSESNAHLLEAMKDTAKALRVGLQPIEVGRPTDLAGAFSVLNNQQIGGLVVVDHVFFIANANSIAALAANYRLPLIGPLELATGGGLMAYGVNFAELFRRAAVFVDKILKGTKPGDIPVEQATKFITIVNIKAAKGLGIEIPTSILLRADEVIE